MLAVSRRWSEIFLIRRCDVGVPWRCASPCRCVYFVRNAFFILFIYFFYSSVHYAGCCSCAPSTSKCWTNSKRQRLAFTQSVGYAITVSNAASTETACQHNAARYINFSAQLFSAAHLSQSRCWRAVGIWFTVSSPLWMVPHVTGCRERLDAAKSLVGLLTLGATSDAFSEHLHHSMNRSI